MRAALQSGRDVALRPVRAGDAGLIQSFVRALSPQSRRSRFFSGLAELPPYMLRRLAEPVCPEEFVLVALVGGAGARTVVGVAQYVVEELCRGELSVVVADAWQGQGLGTRLVQALIDRAAASGVRTLCAVLLPDNRAMLALGRRLGFAPRGNTEPGLVQIERLVTPAPALVTCA